MTVNIIAALISILTLYIGIIVYITLKYKGFVEEDILSEVKLISPAFKLIKNIVSRALLSIEIILILLTMYILSFTVAYTSTFSYSSQILDIKIEYNSLMVRKELVPIEVITSKLHYFIAEYQIFKGFNIGNNTYYVLIAKCVLPDNYEENSTLIVELNELCKYLSSNYVIVDDDSLLDKETISSFLNISLNLIKVDLTKLINLELAPGVYFVHSIGILGGLSLRIENPKELILLPMMNNILASFCPQECDIQTLVISFNSIEKFKINTDEFLKIFDYIIINIDGKAIAISKSFTPTPKTILGIILSFFISMILMYSVGGGFIEKMLSVYNNLYVLGVTKNFFRSAILLGLMIAFLLTSLPLATLSWLGYVNGIALLNYFISSIGFIILTSNRFHGTARLMYPGIIGGHTYVIDTFISMDKLVSCLREMLIDDDFFTVTEIEGIREERFNVVRVELIYKKALSTLASVEIYIDKVDSNVRYNIVVDVWSLEDSSPQSLSSIQRLALSKISGGVLTCIES